ncbi:MAG TPA: phosphopantothenoylcysteine decarboxylase [Opitutaceae bacterium]
MRILVTAGATREPIDAVRFLSNTSTGTTGAALADAWAHAGHAVVLLRGTGAVTPAGAVESESFSSADDLRARLARHLRNGTFDLVVMAAAVADYRPAETAIGKLPSAAEELTLRLVRNPKLLPTLKTLAPNPVRVIGFKLTATADAGAQRAAVAAQFAAGGVDLVVHNDQTDVRTAGPSHQTFQIFTDIQRAPRVVTGTAALAAALLPPSA